MVRWPVLIIVALLITLAYVASVSAFISSDVSLGIFKQDSCINLIQSCDNCTYVNLTAIIKPDNSLDILNASMNNADDTFFYDFCNTSLIGSYMAIGFGDVNGIKTSWNYDFTVTISGNIMESGNGFLYAAIILASIIMMVVFLMMGSSRETENKYSVDGKFVEIEYGKYLKMASYFMAYLAFMLLNFLIYSVTDNTILSFAREMFRMFFLVTVILLVPISIILIIKVSVDFFKDLREMKLTRQGISAFRRGRR